MSPDASRRCALLQEELRATLTPLLDPERRHALVDYPEANNVGDQAIWLGEKALLEERGITPVYECSMTTYDPAALREAIGGGVILMHGGGNFGDLYHYHDFRLLVLRDFPDNDVLVFPQTVMFYDDDKLRATADRIAAHGKVTLCARDALSHHVLRRHFGGAARIVLAPDMAFMLGGMRRPGAARFDVVWLHRTDAEAAFGPRAIAAAAGYRELHTVQARLGAVHEGVEMVCNGEFSGSALLVSDWYRCQFMDSESAAAFERLPFDARSRACVRLGTRVLSLGSVVITDRLHGHILCMQMGIPHVLLNNNYGKNLSHYETWSRPAGHCKLARSPAEAWKLANEMLTTLRHS